jgi:hypothetical protein
MRGLVLLVTLALVPGVAEAKPKDKGEKPAAGAPASPSRGAATSDAARAKAREGAFATYTSELASGQLPRAADALVAIVDDPAQATFHAEAYALLGELLAKRDLPYAAMLAYAKGYELAQDADLDVVGGTVPEALALADKVGDPAALQGPFSKNLGLARTDDVRGRMAYLAAREAFRNESYGVALGVLKMVPGGDPVYPDAKLLEGVILNQQGRAEDALVPFEAAQKASDGRAQDFKDLLALNRARSVYAAGNFPQAITGFGAVSRASEFWPEAQFERAWAHFRLDDMNGALGALMTLKQPFFDDWFWPEADLLRIYASFMMCKFPNANDELEAFKATYAPMNRALKGFIGRGETEVFQATRSFVERGDTGGLPKMLLRGYAQEDRFLASLAALRSVEGELKRLGKASGNPFTERAQQWLEARRDALVKVEGARILARLSAQQQDLEMKLSDAEIFGLDILRMQGQLYEQAAATGKMPNAVRKAQRQERTRKGFREWPYEGEAWADELGYYRIDATPECPASMRRD